ncbi:Lrp/AsnC family transcriptional regulator [Marinobacter sp. TBZ242]|uniref:siroheme decarboxylase n=1 Tax=Marinobacter azerbaijanicus TaxID=3050455 RepID=A0ABT7IBF6_9GAMM|nr:Lrp/AsnC family transcriptional regulator [Marinobacter sp. TBZ242]MDL0431496.1 Lrp/AsnC family transcriptional regulator [Marinobacter sp. TBZ242]
MSAMTEHQPDLATAPTFSEVERSVINRLQTGLPMVHAPYAAVAGELGLTEQELLHTLQDLLDRRILTRFGPMFHAGEMGGGLSLAAMRIPAEEFETVTQQVNRFNEVAHNYRREHELNMWFVVATENPDDIARVIARIESATGYPVYNMPKEEEFHVHLHFPV